MKNKFSILLILFLPFIGFSKGFILKGNIEGLQTGTISLVYANAAGEDTTLISTITAGAFVFTSAVPEPELARLSVTEGWSYSTNFYLENSPINIYLVKDASEKTVIEGSISNTIYQKLQPQLIEFFGHARQNIASHQQAAYSYNSNAIHAADSVWSAQQNQWIQSIHQSISSNHENYAALYFIRGLLFKPDNYESILALFMQLSPAVRQGATGKKLFADMEHIHKTSPGQPAPEITGKDTSGHSVTLASLKGKVVLLDFWASYCGPCRQENRAMIPVYQKYHASGFEVVSLSLDNNRATWINALQTDGLPWLQASELRGGASASADVYEISDLPRNVLIDRTGKIYGKDLHGEELKNALDVLLSKGK